MTLDPVFNDHSIYASETEQTAARALMINLIRVLRDAPDKGLGSALRVPTNFHALELATNYAVYNWIDDPQTPHDEMAFVLRLATMAPFLAGTPDLIQERFLSFDVQVNGQRADCFAAAVLLDLPLVSFCQKVWTDADIAASASVLDEMANATDEEVTIRNISETEHYSAHSDWIRDRRAKNIQDAAELWQHRLDLFPNLSFCKEVQDQLLGISSSDPHFRTIINRLFDLQQYFEGWITGPFDRTAFPKCNPTSSQTLSHRDYGPRYVFTTPSDEKVICGWHLYLTPGPWRLHFSPEPNSRKGIIGHIGIKLPSVTDGVI